MADIQPTQSTNPTPPEAKPTSEKIHLTIRNRIRVLFDDDVKAVTSKNDTGIFDVLPEHSNFISLITSPLIIRKLDGQKQEITFNNGLIKVKENTVHCYIDLLSKENKPQVPPAS
jgi:F0F1-type ATP synthase epsilon subunit